MSMAYAVAGDWILKLIVCPTLTLNGSAKPWMVPVSAFVTLHCDLGVPGSWFSQATGLAQLARAASAPGAAPVRVPRVHIAAARTAATSSLAARRRIPVLATIAGYL